MNNYKKIGLGLGILLILISPQISLATGPFMLPFYESTPISAYVDLELDADIVSDYAHTTPWLQSELGWIYGRAYDGHTGTDYDLDEGSQVAAAADGEIITKVDGKSNTYPTCNDPQGNYYTVEHADNYETRYYHLKNGELLYDASDPVGGGTYIAKSGNTGCSTGDHLHFEVRDNDLGNPILDPYSAELWTTDPPEYFPTYLSQNDYSRSSDPTNGFDQYVGTGLSGATDSITFKVKITSTIPSGAGFSSFIRCYADSAKNGCGTDDPFWNGIEWVVHPANSMVPITPGSYTTLNPLIMDVTFDYPEFELKSNRHYVYIINVDGVAFNFLLLGTEDDLAFNDPEYLFNGNAGSGQYGSMEEAYFILEYLRP